MLTSHAKPISVHDGVHYVTAAPLQTYAIPKVLAPIVSAPVVASPVYHTPVYKHVEPEPYDPNPEYSYSYGVNDPHTGDSKHAQESLKDGIVRGSYSLAEPDGTIRKVTYTADDFNGFNAVVEKQGASKHVTPLKYIAPVISKYVAPATVYQAPIARYVAPAPIYHAPVTPTAVYHSPVAKYIAPATYSAPVAKYIGPTAYHAPLYGYH